MRSAPSRRPSAGLALGAAGLLTGMAALVIALAGTATGLPGGNRIDRNDLRPRVVKAINVQRNAIRSLQLAPGAVRRWHLHRNAVGGWQVQESSLATVPSARSANGVRPVKVDFTAEAGSGTTVFMNQHGIRIEGECFPAGITLLHFVSIAENGVLHLVTHDQAGAAVARTRADWDPPSAIAVLTSDAFPQTVLGSTFSYRGADGTTVTGNLVAAEDTGVAQCVISGTLFVG
jgi:hypothetical protein